MSMKLNSVIVLLLLSINAMAQSNEENKIVSKKELIKRDWFNGDPKTDKSNGVSTNKVYAELLANKKSEKKIIVAVIDAGVEIDHPDLVGAIWTNTKEIPNNGIDDDKNGYVDDIHGWNFMVNADTSVAIENYEATRILRYKKNNELELRGISTNDVKTAQEIYDKAKSELKETEYKNLFFIDSVYHKMTGKSDYTFADIKQSTPITYGELYLQKLAAKIEKAGENIADFRDALKHYRNAWDYQLNLDYEARPTLKKGDRYYGNNDYEGPYADHGTHVAGIIAGNRNNNIGTRGIAHDVVLIMSVRTVPDGDERDEDVANGIRYAVDNGANIINMSFGKGVSFDKKLVYDAIQYALDHDVLLVHSAGNDAEDIDVVTTYPNCDFIVDRKNTSFLTIGALKSVTNKKMLAEFTNYGKTSVDIFAPGYDIYSTTPDYKYEFKSGTSMATPVVVGVAALIWAYYPNLTAVQIKQILMESAIDLKTKKVLLPGKKEKILFGELCVSGGILNAYQAIVMAEKMSK
ncbi:MAG: S8 family serine peptidase [Bacteroidetes bacterium]|nr:S8 family serine peptidase [Bacteroidota bacterium]